MFGRTKIIYLRLYLVHNLRSRCRAEYNWSTRNLQYLHYLKNTVLTSLIKKKNLFSTTIFIDCGQNRKSTLVEIIGMKTQGDMILDKPLAEIGDKGLFTKELETALLENKIDCIVHSFKDVPTNLPCESLVISGVLKRECPLDALVVSDRLDAKFKDVDNLDQFFKLCETEGKLPVSIGTSSLRRRAQLNAKYNEKVKISDIRGNLNTRLRKLDSPKEEEPKFDAIVLATAGLERLGEEFAERITVRIVPEDILYAVGQAALAIESRADDLECLKVVQSIADEVSNFETICERACMRSLEGGCHVPIGVNTVRDEAGRMTVTDLK